MDIRRKPKISQTKFNYPTENREFFYRPPEEQKVFYEKATTPIAPKKKNIFKKIIFWLFFVILALAISGGIFFVTKVYSVSKKMSTSDEPVNFLKTMKSFATPAPVISLEGADDGRINILLLGIAGKGKPGQNLTDTIVVLSINTKTNQVAMLSIPRDLFVEIPDAGYWTKINTVYQYGISSSKNENEQINPLIETVNKITSLDMHYYVVLNFDGFKKIIDSLGGINIISEKDFYDPSYPGPNYSYETFELKKGFHQMDGETALKYARERHNDQEGDFGRAKRQQQVMQAFKNKFFSVGTLVNVFALNNLLNALGENIRTNIDTEEMGSFLELSKKVDTQNVNNMVLDAWNKDSLLKISRNIREITGASALVPRVGNYSEIQELAQNIFDLNEIRRKKEEIAKENTQIILINRSGDASLTEKIKKLLNVSLDYKNVAIKTASGKIIEEKTIIYDMTDGTKPFTLDELTKKLPASVSYSIPSYIKALTNTEKIVRDAKEENEAPPELPMVISLGKDLSEIYNIEEGTMEDLESSRDNEEMLNLKK